MNRENLLTRDEIQADYIEWYIKGATLSELQEAVQVQMEQDLEDLSDEELVKEVHRFAPELIQNKTIRV